MAVVAMPEAKRGAVRARLMDFMISLEGVGFGRHDMSFRFSGLVFGLRLAGGAKTWDTVLNDLLIPNDGFYHGD